MPAFASPTPEAIPIWFVSAESWETVKASIGGTSAAFAERCGFKPKAGQAAARSRRGRRAWPARCSASTRRARRDPLRRRQARHRAARRRLSLRQCAARHRARRARLPARPLSLRALQGRAKRPGRGSSRPTASTRPRIERIAAAVAFGRDLVNTPANDARPQRARAGGGAPRRGLRREGRVIRGDDLLEAQPAARLRRGPRRALELPRLVDFAWGRRARRP